MFEVIWPAGKKGMLQNFREVLFALPGIALTILSWGFYGAVLHKGQAGLGGDRLKPLICVGAAYFIIAIIVPTVWLASAGKLGGWKFGGIAWSVAAGSCGAFGALGIILALTAGGKPTYVMPLVFGGAPIVNVIVSTYFARIPWKGVNPIFYAGMIMVAVGAAVVLIWAPKHQPPAAASHARKIESAATPPGPIEKETRSVEKSGVAREASETSDKEEDQGEPEQAT